MERRLLRQRADAGTDADKDVQPANGRFALTCVHFPCHSRRSGVAKSPPEKAGYFKDPMIAVPPTAVPSPIRHATRVAIIGAGFAGLAAARGLAAAPAHVILIDTDNYHLFQPLLYQVATAALSPADIAEPVRRLLRPRLKGAEVVLGEVVGISAEEKSLRLRDGKRVAFDILVVAAGATHSYFGHPEWEKYAPGLKTIADTRTIRSRLLLCFEQAEMSEYPAERERLMTFVVVGGGPSGVELAGAIAELARHSLTRDFRRIDPQSARIILLEAGPAILSAFPRTLQAYAEKKLLALGVEVRTECAVKDIAQGRVETDGGIIPVGLAIWAAGVSPSPLARLLGAPLDASGRIRVEPDLSVAALPGVYALGDIALCHGADGKPLPGLAQVAKQQGIYLGAALAENIRSGKPARAFVFQDRGNVAIIGRRAAVADFGWLQLTGTLAWLVWAVVHIYLLAGLQHRTLVAIQWLWRYWTYDLGARLIIDDAPKEER
jgi:NADH dehydrogenase